MCQQLYDSIRNIKKEDGTMLCDTFIRAPKRRQEPAYYEVVDKAIDLLKVQQKLKTDEYKEINDLTSDLELLVNNAKAFYKEDSSECRDAGMLWDAYNANRMKLIEAIGDDEPLSKIKKLSRGRKSNANDNDDASETSSKADDDTEPYEELFAAVMTAADDTARPLHTMFDLLPSKKQYPDYYDIIEHPIDLKFIATKIQTNAYISLSEMEKDLLQMTKNACTFNEPGSQIYKDAKTLRKVGGRRSQIYWHPMTPLNSTLADHTSAQDRNRSGQDQEGGRENQAPWTELERHDCCAERDRGGIG